MDTEDALAAGLADDLDATFPRLVEAHQDRLYSIALRVLGRPHDAEEVAQDAFVRAYRALAAMPAAEARLIRLRPWLATIAVRLARNRRRRRADREPAVPLDSLRDLPDEPARPRRLEPEPAMLARDRVALLGELLLRLPPATRVAVVLHHVEGFSFPEIASIDGTTESTVRSRAHRGLAQLRAAYAVEAVRESHHPRRPDPRPHIPPPRRQPAALPPETRR
jgi:RNA polymerase sigma factor (sigma-70 family)